MAPRPRRTPRCTCSRRGASAFDPLCVLLSAACFGRISAGTRELATVAELVHLATLLHDDVVDDADLRRGAVAARRIWGNAVSVLAGDLLLTHALERTAYVAPGATMTELLVTLRRLVDGEVVQLRGRAGAASSEESYFTIVEGRPRPSSRGLRAPVHGPARRRTATWPCSAKSAATSVSPFSSSMTRSTTQGDAKVTGKDLLVDLREGKITLPLLLAIEERPRLAAIVDRARAGDDTAAADILAAVRDVRGSERARARAAAPHAQRARPRSHPFRRRRLATSSPRSQRS